MPAPRRLTDALRRLASALTGGRRCAICGQRIEGGGSEVCAACLTGLPFTGFHGCPDNAAERLFRGLLPVERAGVLLRYRPLERSRFVLLRLKYFHAPASGVALGRLMARDVLPTGFFRGVDAIVPVPLTPQRLRRRGYNQSERLARGIADVTGLPVETQAVRRVVERPSQTTLHGRSRRENVEGVFRLADPARVAGRHLLMVDDVLTTGSTLLALGRTLMEAGGVRLSVLTLALAGAHHVVEDGGIATP